MVAPRAGFKTQRWAICFLVRYGKEVAARENIGKLWKNLSLPRGSGVRPESCLLWELKGAKITVCICMAFCFFHSVCSPCTNPMLHVGKGRDVQLQADICPGSPACERPFNLLISSAEVHTGVLPSFEDSGRSACIPYPTSVHSPKFRPLEASFCLSRVYTSPCVQDVGHGGRGRIEARAWRVVEGCEPP